MSKAGMIGAAFSIAVVGWSVDAHATTLTNPFGSRPVTAYVGSDSAGQWIGWKDQIFGACHWDWIGDTTGLNDNYLVYGGAGADGIFVVSTPITFCGYPLGVPSYGGRFMTIMGNGGNDKLWSPGTLDTNIDGGGGNDWIMSGRGSSFLYGDVGNDLIFGSGSGYGGEKYGNWGDDCLFIAVTLERTRAVCGEGTDRWSGPGTQPPDCEIIDTHCCGLCPF